MKNAALARQLEADLVSKPLALEPAPPSRAAAQGFWQRLWDRLFGPPQVEPSAAAADFSTFRALYEIGADHLPSSGTWPL